MFCTSNVYIGYLSPSFMQNRTEVLHLIVPCYQPPSDWPQCIASRYNEFQTFISDLLPVRLTLVIDGECAHFTEDSEKAFKNMVEDCQIIYYPVNRGKGYALRKGVEAVNGNYFMVTDADFPYTMESMRAVLQMLLNQGGIVAGNRNTNYYKQVPFSRKLLSKFMRWVLKKVLRQPVDDSQCGLKAFDLSGKALFLQTRIDRFLFDLEFLMLAKNRVKTTPVPVELRKGVKFSPVSWRMLQTEVINFIRLSIRLR
jgi:glycosyltransferase involved in cell wall biosynthesis